MVKFKVGDVICNPSLRGGLDEWKVIDIRVDSYGLEGGFHLNFTSEYQYEVVNDVGLITAQIRKEIYGQI